MGGLFGSMGFDLAFGRPLGETVAGNACINGALFAATLAEQIYSCSNYMIYNRWIQCNRSSKY